MGHHYIPQHYLRQFSVDKKQKQIWMYDLANSRVKTIDWCNAASENGYYSAGDEIVDGKSDRMARPRDYGKIAYRKANLELDERMRVATYVRLPGQ